MCQYINVVLHVFSYYRPDLQFNAQCLIVAPCNDRLVGSVYWDLENMYKIYYRLIFEKQVSKTIVLRASLQTQAVI